MKEQEEAEPSTERQFIAYRFNEVFKRLDRMEQTMNGFAFAKQSEVDKLSKKIEDFDSIYVKKESLKPIIVILTGVAIGVGIAIVVAVIKVIGDVL